MYEEASKKLVKDEDFNRNWFHQMILRSDIDGARKVALYMYEADRKAAMVLYKLPNQRKYFYWLLTAWKVSSVVLHQIALIVESQPIFSTSQSVHIDVYEACGSRSIKPKSPS